MSSQPIVEARDGRVVEVVLDDGYRLKYRTWSGPSPRATLFLLSGVMSHSAWFQPLAPHLTSGGMRVVAVDRRGSGECQAARGDAPSPERLTEDLLAVVDREHVAGRPLFILGWCWGAVWATNAALASGRDISGLVLIAPGLFPSEEVCRRAHDGTHRAAGRPLDEACVTVPITEEMFTDGPWLEFIRADGLRLRRFTPRFARILTKMGAIARSRLDRLDLPILVVLARRDGAVDNAATRRAFEGRMHTTLVELDSQHGMLFEVPEQLGLLVASWIADREGGDER